MLATRVTRCLVMLPFALAIPLDIAPRQANDSQAFTRLIVFGDSFSDDGNGAWIVSNETWPSDPAYYGHHFSNGPVWAQDMATNLSLELLDYGVGGATADNSFVQGYTGYNSTIPVPSTSEQIDNFLSNNTFESTDIAAIYIGYNDLFFNSSVTGGEISALILGQVSQLYNAGVQTVLLASYPLINTSPSEESANHSTQLELAQYTQNLTLGLNIIAAAWSPYINIAVADIEGLFSELYADPEGFGFNSSYVNPSVACLTGTYPDSGPRELCDDPDQHVYFDIYHPTRQVHNLMAGEFIAALSLAVGGL